MKVVAFSDLHCDPECTNAILAASGNADLVLGVGDFAQRHEGLEETLAALEPISEKTVLVPGNNETEDALRAATSATVLHGDAMSFCGLSIAGIGGAVPPLPPMPWRSFDVTEDEAETLLSEVSVADILLSHSPAKGHGDQHHKMGSIGSTAVLAATERLKPKWLLTGHVHDSWGYRGRVGSTQVANLGPVPVYLEIAP